MATAPPTLKFSGGTLVLEGYERAGVPELGAGVEWVWDSRVRGWRCDAISYSALRDDPRLKSARIADAVPAWRRITWPGVELRKLRPDQQKAVACWNQTGRGCIVMPTGTGKTEVALHLMAGSAISTLVVAPVRDLMYQWHRRIAEGLGYDAGIVGDHLFRLSPVSVTTYDSACIHMERFGNQFGMIIFDECHHLPGRVRSDAARMCAAPLRLGLTATPERSDGRHTDLDHLIGPIVYEVPISLARGNTLADYEVVRIPVHLTAEEQRQYDRLSRELCAYMLERRETDPDFNWEKLCSESVRSPESRRAMRAFLAKKSIENRAEEKLRVIEDLFRLHAGEPCLIFAGSNAMARDVSLRFLIPCLLSHCGKKERLDVLQGLESRFYPALVANQVLDEGVDLPEVKVAIVIGGKASTRQAKQRLGRILRKSGNSRAILYEVVCTETNEERRSRARRRSDAYEKVRHRRPTMRDRA
ncbi:MAG: DEAD/DEAH box helicase family protein [Deltaproteobacteria bacterium]